MFIRIRVNSLGFARIRQNPLEANLYQKNGREAKRVCFADPVRKNVLSLSEKVNTVHCIFRPSRTVHCIFCPSRTVHCMFWCQKPWSKTWPKIQSKFSEKCGGPEFINRSCRLLLNKTFGHFCAQLSDSRHFQPVLGRIC